MSNYLKMPKKTQVLALLELSWSYRRCPCQKGDRSSKYCGAAVSRALRSRLEAVGPERTGSRTIIQGQPVQRSTVTKRSAPAPVLRRAPFVAIVKATDLRDSDDASVATCCDRARNRRVLRERKMCS